MTGDELFGWFELKEVKKYYLHGKLYGLIGTSEYQGVTYVCATTRHEDIPFSISMIKDVILLYNTRVICTITEVKSKQKLVARAFERFNLDITYNEEGVMFMTGGRGYNKKDRLWQ